MAISCARRCASPIAWFLSSRTLLHGGDASTTLPQQRSTTPHVSTHGGVRQGTGCHIAIALSVPVHEHRVVKRPLVSQHEITLLVLFRYLLHAARAQFRPTSPPLAAQTAPRPRGHPGPWPPRAARRHLGRQAAASTAARRVSATPTSKASCRGLGAMCKLWWGRRWRRSSRRW